VRLSGVVTVFAMLIIPATASALFVSAGIVRLLLAWVTIVIASLGGLVASTLNLGDTDFLNGR